MLWAKVYAVVLAAMLAIDLGWLIAMRRFYRSALGSHLATRTNWPAALVFYGIFAGGVVFFVVAPTAAGTPFDTILAGAVFGIVTYATYDLTNHATLSRWPLALTLVDMCWGTALSIVLGFAGRAAVQAL